MAELQERGIDHSDCVERDVSVAPASHSRSHCTVSNRPAPLAPVVAQDLLEVLCGPRPILPSKGEYDPEEAMKDSNV